MNICEWCSSKNVKAITNSVYWELPDGSKAIKITDTPALSCLDCKMTYQSEQITKEIEDQLFLINTKQLDKEITFEELMAHPWLLKKITSIFEFYSLII